MSVYLHKFATQAECDAYTESEYYIEPFTALIAENSGKVVYNVTSGSPVPPGPTPPPPVDYTSMPFTVEVVSGSGNFWITPNGDSNDYLHYSLDGGENWILINNSSTSLTVNAGDTIQIKGYNQVCDNAESRGGGILSEGSGSGLKYVFYGNIMSLVREDDFENMVTFPSSDMCFKEFFGSIYYGPACAGLVSAEHLILPATTLTEDCYREMFASCTGLTTAPELPAATLADCCYQSMFNGCSSLNYIKCLVPNISSTYTYNWTYGVSSTGTFVKNANATWTTGTSGIPNNWTVQDAS